MTMQVDWKSAMDLLAALALIEEKAKKIENAADGSKSIAETRSELSLKSKARISPLMDEEHAKLVAIGKVKPEEMDKAYWTAYDMGDYVVTGNNSKAKEK